MTKADLVKNAATLRTLTFKYDPFGRRVEKIVVNNVAANTTTWSYLYDGDDIVQIKESDATSTHTTHLTHGPGIDEPLAMVRDGVAYLYHADGLGSIVAISDDQGTIVQRYSYESFGMVTATDPTFPNAYTYTGREWDKEFGLYYYRARYYDPLEGRFISKDPIGFAGGDVNLYGYVGNRPIMFTDAFGLNPFAPLKPRTPGSGCGDKDTDCIVPDIYPDACTAHDKCYATPGKTRLECDNELWLNAFNESGPSPNVFGPTIFWLGVRFGGDSAYEQAQRIGTTQ